MYIKSCIYKQKIISKIFTIQSKTVLFLIQPERKKFLQYNLYILQDSSKKIKTLLSKLNSS